MKGFTSYQNDLFPRLAQAKCNASEIALYFYLIRFLRPETSERTIKRVVYKIQPNQVSFSQVVCATETGMSRSTVWRTLKAMQGHGVLSAIGGSAETTLLTFSDVWLPSMVLQNEAGGASNSSMGVLQNEAGGCSILKQGGASKRSTSNKKRENIKGYEEEEKGNEATLSGSPAGSPGRAPGAEPPNRTVTDPADHFSENALHEIQDHYKKLVERHCPNHGSFPKRIRVRKSTASRILSRYESEDVKRLLDDRFHRDYYSEDADANLMIGLERMLDEIPTGSMPTLIERKWQEREEAEARAAEAARRAAESDAEILQRGNEFIFALTDDEQARYWELRDEEEQQQGQTIPTDEEDHDRLF